MGSVQHRRVDLQSPLDLTYLHRATLAAAQQKLDQSFPPSHSDGDEDPLRRRVDELVNQYVHDTWLTATHSISVASLPANPRFTSLIGSAGSAEVAVAGQTEEDYDPFDAALASRLQGLHARVEMLRSQTATLRREAPAKAAAAYRERVAAEIEADESTFRGDVERLERDMVGGLGGAGILDWDGLEVGGAEDGGRPAERREEMSRVWDRALRGLVDLKGDMTWSGAEDNKGSGGLTGTTARVRRGVEVSEYLRGNGRLQEASTE